MKCFNHKTLFHFKPSYLLELFLILRCNNETEVRNSFIRRQYQKARCVMAKYYVNMNPQDNGDHEAHKEGCTWMPIPENRKYLGDFTNCHDAVREAKKYDSKADGCYYCSRECHTR